MDYNHTKDIRNTTCPHCGRTDCVRSIVYQNVESYGSTTFHLPCVFCGRMIYVIGVRTTRIMNVERSVKNISESDF